MEEDFIVYTTTQARLYRLDKQRVLECPDDGSRFIFTKTLGKGSFSRVKLAERHWTTESNEDLNAEYAIKIMHRGILKRQRCVIYDRNNHMKMTNNWEKIENEIAIWRSLCHLNVIRLYEIIDVAELEYIYLVIEYADYGQIMQWDSSSQGYQLNPLILPVLKAKFPEEFTKHNDLEALGKLVLQQIITGIQYLHSKFVIHKDIKPDNILFCSNEALFKLTDFTISEKLEGREALCYNPPGTTPFQAPESMLSGEGFVGEKADIWALGIFLYSLMSGGKLPFWDPESEIYTQMAIQNSPIAFPESFSQSLVDLLQGLLHKDPSQRITLEQASRHMWLVA